MSDPVDDLEAVLVHACRRAGVDAAIGVISECIIDWRSRWGGSEYYIARRSHLKRHAEIVRMVESGMTTAEIAGRLGISIRQVQRLARRSTAIL